MPSHLVSYVVIDAGRIVEVIPADTADEAYAAQTQEGCLFLPVGGELSPRALSTEGSAGA